MGRMRPLSFAMTVAAGRAAGCASATALQNAKGPLDRAMADRAKNRRAVFVDR